VSHFRNTAAALKPGGVYIVSISSAWEDLDSSNWDISQAGREGRIEVCAEWDVERQDWERKLSYQVCRMEVRDGGSCLRFEEHHTFRLWYLEDFRELIRQAACFELQAIYDQQGRSVPPTARITGEMDELLYVLKAL
jgi:hypothetical protein